MLAAGCRHDGREMRPALPSQDGSVSTTAPPTVPDIEDGFFESAPTVAGLPGGPIEPTTTGTGPSTVAALVGPLEVTAPWRDGSPIDPRYTCEGENVSPALSWSEAPAGTQEIAIVLVDQDFDFDHWAIAGIGPDVTNIAEDTPPPGAVEALNGSGAAGYAGPCPPSGETHTYRITVHYLDQALTLTSGAVSDDMRFAIDEATIATAQVTGTFTG
jgi:Raf kinase inhibitor-like YbhB/YbcL family protein